MPGKLKVYGKRGGAVVSDAFGKLSESPVKNEGIENQSIEIAEALSSTDAVDLGGNRRRRGPLKIKGSNARFTKREIAKLRDGERSAFDEKGTSSARHGKIADYDQSLQDRLERLAEVSEGIRGKSPRTKRESMSSLSSNSRAKGGGIPELERLLRNTRLDSSTTALSQDAINRPAEQTGLTGFPARERSPGVVGGHRAASSANAEDSHGLQHSEQGDNRQLQQPRKTKKQAETRGSYDWEDETTLFQRNSTSSASTPESAASTASLGASSLGRRAETPEGKVLKVRSGQGLNVPLPETTYLSADQGTTRTIRKPRRAPVPKGYHPSTENGTVQTRRGPVRAPVTRPAACPDGPIVNTETLEYLSPLLEVAKGRLDETPVCSFRDWVDRLCQQKYELVKVGEGSFGETYRTMITPTGSTVPVLGKTIFKVIPLRARSGVGSRNFVPVAEAVSEIELLARMTSIPGLTLYQEAYVMCGSQPPPIVSACEIYIHSPNHRPSDRPAVKKYIPSQLWVIIEMQYAGVDLQRFALSSYWQTWDIFWGAAIALARAEVVARFEHRDLHLGNVCVQANATNDTMDGPLQLTKREAEEVKFGFSGVEVTLIDYTLSRADIAPGRVAFNELQDGRGICDRAELGGQFATYSMMRAEVFLRDPKGNYADVAAGLVSAGEGWKQHRPRTNLLWLHFLLSEIRQISREQGKDRPRIQRLPGSDPNDVGSEERSRSLYSSLKDKLNMAFKLLDPETLTRSELYSASDLVQHAVEQGWLNESDLEN